MGIKAGRTAVAPGSKAAAGSWGASALGEPLGQEDAKWYRGVAARALYLSLGRLDIQCAAKECCKGMARPSQDEVRKVKHLAKYVTREPRLIMKYDWRDEHVRMTGYSDADWAGIPENGVIVFRRYLGHWGRT